MFMNIPAGIILTAILGAPVIQAQDAVAWQTKAGSKMTFEVASLKPSKGAYVPSNPPLTPWDEDIATNGHFSADATLEAYIEFAWKLWTIEPQRREFSHLPKWASTDRYSIEARAATANPTKDQMRLMVQSLLADRFQLAVHFEAREIPVFELRLAKAGQPGPKLIFHGDGPACDKPGSSPGDGLPGFPADCHSLMAINKSGTALIMLGSRDVSLDVLAGVLSTLTLPGVGRPLIDKTGLKGRFDFTLEWAPEPRGTLAADPPAPTGPTPLEALREQLGLKLEPARASLSILVIDGAERPSSN
jgi:uncharacterized protein (TIGR03435 family)